MKFVPELIKPMTYVSSKSLNKHFNKPYSNISPFKLPDVESKHTDNIQKVNNSSISEAYNQLQQSNTSLRNTLFKQDNYIENKDNISATTNIREIARKITVQFEGSEVTGNFDGQGISIGFLQWNIGSGTLQPLLKQMIVESPNDFNNIFAGQVVAKDLYGNTVRQPMSDVIKNVMNMSESEQLQWAKSINDDNNIKEPWKSAFNNLVNNDNFIKIEEEFANTYFNNAERIINDKEIGVKTMRGYALAFDIAVQNGSVKSSAKSLIKEALMGKQNKLTNEYDISLTNNQRYVIKDLNRRLKGVTDNNLKKLYYTAAAVSISSNDKYVKDVWSRKSSIVEGTGTVHGTSHNFERTLGLNDRALV